jgi:hypothetical protein
MVIIKKKNTTFEGKNLACKAKCLVCHLVAAQWEDVVML